jgi:hypothetical protein
MRLETEKLANAGLVLLIAYTAVSGVCRAALKRFWCDEVITVSLARLPTLLAVGDGSPKSLADTDHAVTALASTGMGIVLCSLPQERLHPLLAVCVGIVA